MHAGSMKDKVVVIGDGAGNLGGLISRVFAADGAKAIVVHYDNDTARDAAEETIAAARASGAEVLAFHGDLTKVDEIERLFDETTRTFGRVDVAVNATGMAIRKPFIEVSEDDYDSAFAANSKAAFFFMREAGKRLSDGGRLCTIVTSSSDTCRDDCSVYEGSKAPVEHFTRALARELGERGISVTAVAPGPMPGPMDVSSIGDQAGSGAEKDDRTAVVLGKFTRTGLTEPRDVVSLVQYLVTEGRWITGQTIRVNGGHTI